MHYSINYCQNVMTTCVTGLTKPIFIIPVYLHNSRCSNVLERKGGLSTRLTSEGGSLWLAMMVTTTCRRTGYNSSLNCSLSFALSPRRRVAVLFARVPRLSQWHQILHWSGHYSLTTRSCCVYSTTTNYAPPQTAHRWTCQNRM